MHNQANKKKRFFGFGHGLVAISAILAGGATLAGCSGGGSSGGGSASTVAAATSGSIQNVRVDSISVVSVTSNSTVQVENGLNSGFQLLVDGNYTDDRGQNQVIDATRLATYSVEDDTIATVNNAGLITPQAEGATRVFVEHEGQKKTVLVSVTAAAATQPTFVDLKVLPGARTLRFVNPAARQEQLQQVVVYATDNQGVTHDLTRSVGLTLQDDQGNVTNGGNVDANGLFRGVMNGKVWVVARLSSLGLVAGAEFVLGTGVAAPVDPNQLYSGAPLAGSSNAIDQAVLQNLFNQFIEPAATASDGEFVRRLYSDALGRTPTETEAQAFLASTDATKRADEVDKVLASAEFSAHWAGLMAEWFEMGGQQAAFETWARGELSSGKSLGEMTSAMISGQVASFDTRHDTPVKRAGIFLQTGAAMTARCAECHDHPLIGPNDTVKWTQSDFYPVVAFFAGNATEATALDGRTGTRVGNPHDPGFPLDPSATVTTTLTDSVQARRDEFAQIFPNSSAFKRGLAHRIFAEVGTPLLDPNQFLAKNLDAVAVPNVLAAIESVFDAENTSLQGFLRQVFTSQWYGLSSDATNLDTTYDNLLQRHLVRRQHAEVMENALNELTGATITGGDLGFLHETWGLPAAKESIAERSDAVNMSQALVLMNSPVVQDRIEGAKLTQLAADVDAGTITQAAAVEALWVSALSRKPTSAELSDANDVIGMAASVEEGLKDVATALASSIEFSMR